MQQKTLFITRLSLLLALTMVIQMVGLPQPVTGPLINAMLYMTTILSGWLSGIILGCLTPIIALLRGQLPPAFAPMIPFIMVGNTLLVVVFHRFLTKTKVTPIRRIKIYAGIIFASFVKFSFLSLSIKLLIPLIIAYDIPDKFAIMMTIPQFFTALIGGVIALLIYEILYRSEIVT